MRTLNDVVAAVRLGQATTEEELRTAVVAFDVLLYALDLPNDPERLRAYFKAAEMDMLEFIGPNNDPNSEEQRKWYAAMQRVTSKG